MSSYSDDALHRRLERLVENVPAPSAFAAAGDFCLGTSIGSVRQQNQDRCLIALVKNGDAPNRSFAVGVVADGIGGLSSGDRAAAIGIATFLSRVLRTPRLEIRERLFRAAMSANEAVFQSLHARGGATLSAVMVRANGETVGVNVGDSRIYGISKQKKLVQLTRDDTLAGFLGRKEQGDHRNQLVQYVGMGEGFEPHIIEMGGSEYTNVLITSDGVHGAPHDALTQCVQYSTNNIELVQKLSVLSDVLGGRDNATSLVMPTRFDEVSLDQGMSLTFVSPGGPLELWLPILQDLNRPAERQSAFKEISDVGSGNLKAGQRPRAPEIKDGPKPGSKRSKKKDRRGQSPTLPLDQEDPPKLEIEFPKDEGE